jgi:predicted dithiol-disulfide oxidoreductase (DUF899 family)
MDTDIARLEKELRDVKERLSAARRRAGSEVVGDYKFGAKDGSTPALVDLFGKKADLIVVTTWDRSASIARCGRMD